MEKVAARAARGAAERTGQRRCSEGGRVLADDDARGRGAPSRIHPRRRLGTRRRQHEIRGFGANQHRNYRVAGTSQVAVDKRRVARRKADRIPHHPRDVPMNTTQRDQPQRRAKPRVAKRPKPAPVPAEPTPYGRQLFAQLARPFIIPAGTLSEGLRLIFDLESDGLLETVTRVHCIVIGEPDSARVYEYGPDRIPDALAHLTRADTLIGHNVQSYDLPVLRKLYGWSPASTCRVVDTLIAGRLILPNLTDLDGEVAKRAKDKAFGQIYGKYSLEAWGVRFGVAKIGAEIENWSQWTPEVQARCVGDGDICKRLWQFLPPDGYPRPALDLEHAVAAICDRITTDGAPFDRDAAEQLRADWEARRAALGAQLLAQFPTIKNLNSRVQIAALLKTR